MVEMDDVSFELIAPESTVWFAELMPEVAQFFSVVVLASFRLRRGEFPPQPFNHLRVWPDLTPRTLHYIILSWREGDVASHEHDIDIEPYERASGISGLRAVRMHDRRETLIPELGHFAGPMQNLRRHYEEEIRVHPPIGADPYPDS